MREKRPGEESVPAPGESGRSPRPGSKGAEREPFTWKGQHGGGSCTSHLRPRTRAGLLTSQTRRFDAGWRRRVCWDGFPDSCEPCLEGRGWLDSGLVWPFGAPQTLALPVRQRVRVTAPPGEFRIMTLVLVNTLHRVGEFSGRGILSR